jgi:hypothetical protein
VTLVAVILIAILVTAVVAAIAADLIDAHDTRPVLDRERVTPHDPPVARRPYDWNNE